MSQDALLIVATSEVDATLYYATRFLAPDPFVFLQVGGRRIVLMSDLEIDRARAQARVDEVLSLTEYEGKARPRSPASPPHVIDTIGVLLEAHGVDAVTVPSTFPLEYGDRLRTKGVRVTPRPDPFFPERLIKAPEEVAAIAETQRHTETAFEAALSLLRESRVAGDRVLWKGRALTVEDLKKAINVSLMENDCVAQHTIVACGIDGVDPHNQGSGPIRPNESIVFDIFPRSSRSRYFADMTRTVVKGRASDALRRMYEAVLAAQLKGIELVRDGASGAGIHAEVARTLEARGFETGLADGRMQGFFHGTGHGVGLDIHEPPRISKTGSTLQAGQVVTVEPGLYYSRWGAVRIEDLVLVEPGGGRNLTGAPKGELLEL